jgi:hypothetical protein
MIGFNCMGSKRGSAKPAQQEQVQKGEQTSLAWPQLSFAGAALMVASVPFAAGMASISLHGMQLNTSTIMAKKAETALRTGRN